MFHTYALAHYDFISQIVMLSSIERKDFEEKSFTGLSQLLTNHGLKIVLHECRHHHDFIGTSWGISLQKKIFEAFDATIDHWKGPNPSTAQRINDLSSVVNSISRSDLNYTKEGSSFLHEYDGILRMRIHEENGLKIPLLIFNNKDGDILGSYPITLECLLETNAMYEEIWFHSALVENLNEFEKIIEDRSYYESEILPLFSSETIVYCLVPIIVDKQWNGLTIGDSYYVASFLATLCLNLTSKSINGIPIPENFLALNVNSNDLFESRGLLFMVLIQNYVSSHLYNSNYLSWDDFLKSNHLPAADKIQIMVNDHFEELSLSEGNRFQYMFNACILAGKEYSNSRLIFGADKSSLQIMIDIPSTRPHFIFGGDYWEIDREQLLKSNVGKGVSLQEWYELAEIIKEILKT